MTWTQIIDDVVKIGLGALIAGFFTCLVSRHNARSAIQKLIFERRSKILSEAAQTVESFFQAFFKYSALLCAIAETSKAKPENPSGEAFYHVFLANQATEAVNLHRQMMERTEQMFTAQSQLMLLGEEECQNKAEALHAAIMAADSSYKFDGKSFSLAEWKPTSEAVRDARATFYREMQNVFKKM
jgi:hypothetical protein